MKPSKYGAATRDWRQCTLGLFLRLPYSQRVDQWMQAWQAEEARLVVPTLKDWG